MPATLGKPPVYTGGLRIFSEVTKITTNKFDDLIKVCEGHIRLGPGEYPASDYPWGFKEVSDTDELIEAFRHGNWSVRTGFVLGDLAFVEQVSGGNEWLALKNDQGHWNPFDSISFYQILENRGEDYCREYIERLRNTPWQALKCPQQEPQIDQHPRSSPTMGMT